MKKIIITISIAISVGFYATTQACTTKGYKEVEALAKTNPFALLLKIRSITYTPSVATAEWAGFDPDWDIWKNLILCANQYILTNYPQSLSKEYLPLLIKIRNSIEKLAFEDLPDVTKTAGRQTIENWIKWLSYDVILTDYIKAISLREIDKSTPAAKINAEKIKYLQQNAFMPTDKSGTKKAVYFKAKDIFPHYEEFFQSFFDAQKKLKHALSSREIKEILESKRAGILQGTETAQGARERITELFAQLEMLRSTLVHDNSWFGKSDRTKKIEMIDKITNAILREYNLILPYLPIISGEVYTKLFTTKNSAALITLGQAYALKDMLQELIVYYKQLLK